MSKIFVIIVLSHLIHHVAALDVCKDGNFTDCQSCVNTNPVQSPYIDNCMKTCGVCKSGENVALGKPTNQSSLDFSGISSRAVDGETNDDFFSGGSCTHTRGDNPGWWCINLEQIYNIINITIYNRAREKKRLQGFELKISSSDQCNGAGFMSAEPCYKDTSQEILPVYNITECNQPSSTSLSARTFFINVTGVLTLCEVQIYTGICSDGYYNVSNSRCKACNTCVGNECNPESGMCNDGCKDGYKDSRCTTACPTNCVRCNDSSCSVCKPGWYGTNCQQRCNEGCLNTTCTKSNGSCSICKSGWYATNCQERCSEGCLNITCSKSDGSCSVCKPGWYGTNCDSVCSGNCNDGCNKSNGICNECKQGYVGLFCDIECGAICQPIMNGAKELNECDVDQDCSKNCTEICVDEICNHKSLNCSYGCIGGKKGHSCSKPLVSDNIPTANDNTAIIATVVSVLLLILICCLVVFLVFKHKRRKQKNPDGIDDNIIRLHEHVLNDTNGENAYVNIAVPDTDDDKSISTRIDLKDLLIYTKRKKKDETFQTEFEVDLPGGLIMSCEVALNAMNKTKNRYKKICAFDHSRVKLDIENDDPNSDYINACYITGYGGVEKRYIASQGPVDVFVNDFWRMIWDVKSGKILMLTNLSESGVKKCVQYWPDSGEIKTFGKISITMSHEVCNANFTIRTLKVTKDDCETRTIKQYHYTSWPDKGVPADASSLVEFRNKVNKSPTSHPGPMIVHCSAGIGRTGTFLALDYLIEEGKAEGSVDVVQCVSRMRSERVNMVQNLDQYIFIHEALTEWHVAGDPFPVPSYQRDYQKLLQVVSSSGKTELQERFELLGKLIPKTKKDSFYAALEKENGNKNRDMTVLAADSVRIYLNNNHGPDSTDYINAVFLPSYRKKQAYILTQTPLPDTVIDFWRMVVEWESSIIIDIDSKETADSDDTGEYLPEGTPLDCGPFTVVREEEKGNESGLYTTVTCSIRYKNNFQRKVVQIYRCNFWNTGSVTPKSASLIFNLLENIKSSLDGEVIVTVHCLNGADKSGLFCVLTAILERLTIEQDVSVLQTILQLRASRPQIITSYEQLKFCFDAVGEYLDHFSTYANSC